MSHWQEDLMQYWNIQPISNYFQTNFKLIQNYYYIKNYYVNKKINYYNYIIIIMQICFVFAILNTMSAL